MEIYFSKCSENNLRSKPQCELNFPVTMDYDSGYISHNPESNSDSSLENLTETLTNTTCSRPIYLSEDALLEKPEINTNPGKFSTKIQREYEETGMEEFNSPDLIPSSVISQKTNYSGFQNDSDSNLSVEISPAKQIIVESLSTNDSPVSNISSVHQSLVESYNSNVGNYKEVQSEEADSSSRLENWIEDLPQRSGDSSDMCALNNITNKSNNVSNEIESKKKLTLIFSKCDKENIYSVKRKYRSITPDKSYTPEKLLPDLENTSELNGSSTSEEPDKPDTTTTEEYIKLENDLKEDNSNIEKASEKSVENTLVLQEIFSNQFENELKMEKFVDNKLIPEVIISNKFENELNNSCKNMESTKSEKTVENSIILEEIVSKEQTLERVVSEEEKSSIYSETNKNDNRLETHNGSSISMTPEKKYENSIDPNISPDLFGEEETNIERKNETQSFSYIAEEKYVIKKDHRLLKRVQNDLKGVLPPLSVTVVQMSINEMLNRLESNKDYFWLNSCSVESSNDKTADSFNSSNEISVIEQPSSLLITGTSEDCVNKDWPEILEERYHGLHFNRSKLSEEFEELCAKYGQRYVGAETQSTCTVFQTNFVSPVKRKQLKQRWPVKSPGRRLSHLAKRRITFSGSNLQAGTSSVASSRARQILVDARKLDMLNRRKSPRKSPRKTPRKSPRVKTRTPSSSAKKKLAMRFRALTGEIENTSASASNQMLSKRALFQSPDRDKNSNLFLPSTSGISTFKNDLKNPNTKRALFISPSKNSPIKKSPFKRSPFKRLELGVDKKRKRIESEDSHPSKISKSASIIRPSESEVQGKFVKTTNRDMNVSLNRTISTQSGELSDIHKKKLQWAVYEALRSQSVTPSHAQFKIFASILARVTRRFLPNLNGAYRPEGGTSERMLRIARNHVYAVVKGKSVDEIIGDYIKNRSRNVKPQGYVGIEEYNEKNRETNNKENAVQGRVNTIESLEKKKLEQLGSDNKIERIRKVINFGEDNR